MENPSSHIEDNELQEALSPVVNAIIDTNFGSIKEDMTAHIAPLLGPAIKDQVKNQKDDIVDALYPVIGNMISRYVTKSLEEMLGSINAQVQSGLSYKSLKRKIKAKVQGVSEAELLFNENAFSNIQAIFLIHKDTGIILSQAQNPNHKINDSDMLASMMTAIRSFVNDWVSQDGENKELGEIDYSGNKIIIEASNYSYLAVIVEGAAYKVTYEKIRETLGTVIAQNGEDIREFEGDLEAFSQLKVDEKLEALLLHDNSQEEVPKNVKIHPLMYIVPLLLLSWWGFSMYENYMNESLKEKVDTKLYKTASLTSYRLNTKVKDGVVTLGGEVPFFYYKQLASKLITSVRDVVSVDNKIIVVPTLSDPVQINAYISYVILGLNTHKGLNLHYEYDYENLKVLGTASSEVLKKSAMDALSKIKGITSISDEIKLKVPLKPQFKSEGVYFDRGFTTLNKEAKSNLREAIRLLKNIDKSHVLYVTSYSDLIGNSKKNTRLAIKRIENVIKFLQLQGKITNKFVITQKNTPPPGIDSKKEPQKARCVVISSQQGDINAGI